jgi:UDP-glucose 4-epimerase
LTFQRAAASSIARYFIGPFAPLRLLRWQRVPILPFPAGLRFQAVHSDDVAAAYVAAISKRVGGAFNIAAPPVVTGPQLAGLLHGVHVPVPPGVVKRAADLTWRARLQPTEPGWIQLARHVPVMDCTRAESLLDWTATRSAIDTVAELLKGFADHAGTASPPLRPRPGLRHRLHAAGGSGSR